LGLQVPLSNTKIFCRSVGLDHPDSVVVSIQKTSHIITETWWSRENPNELWGRLEIIKTPMGLVVESIVLAECTLGVSSRGLGSTQLVNGANVVQDDFMLVCWDIVSEPSTPGAFVFKEGREVTPDEIKMYLNESGRNFYLDNELDRIAENYNRLKMENR
jgi:hypothetical protein